MLSCFFFFFIKKIAKGLDRTVLTGSSGPTPVLTVHGINKKSGSLGLKNRFSSRFPVFTIRPPGLVRFWKQWTLALTIGYCTIVFFVSSMIYFCSMTKLVKLFMGEQNSNLSCRFFFSFSFFENQVVDSN